MTEQDRPTQHSVLSAQHSPEPSSLAEHLALVDAVDTLLNRGVVLVGNATVSLAGVDLVYLGLNLFLASAETLRRGGARGGAQPLPPDDAPTPTTGAPPPTGGEGQSGPLQPDASTWYTPAGGAVGDAAGAGGSTAALPVVLLGERVAIGSAEPSAGPLAVPSGQAADQSPEQGLARLVLTLVELLRQILERQALRRMEGNSLSEADLERMGLALEELEEKMAELRRVFGLKESDLNLDLGPLGKLL